MVCLQHSVRIITVAQRSSYRHGMSACVEATPVRTTAIRHRFQRTWWKKYTLKISLCNCIHTYTDSVELPLQSLVSTAYLVPWRSQMSTALCHYGHWCLLQVLCHYGHCCPMQTPYLAPCWSLVSTAYFHLVMWQAPVYVLQCLDMHIFISLPRADWWREIQGHTYTMSCGHHRMSKLEVINASMKITYCHQMACINKRLQLYIYIPTNCTQLIFFINNTLKYLYWLKL